jgi:hypothetical protein
MFVANRGGIIALRSDSIVVVMGACFAGVCV